MFRGFPSSYSSSPAVTSAGEALAEPAVDPLLSGRAEPKDILVTGASGFVGRHLLPRLQDRGHRVRGLCRDVPTEAPPARLGWWGCDIVRADRLAGAAEGCDVVVHLAGVTESGEHDFQSVHVTGTRNVVAEAERAGVERFIHVSTVGAQEDARSDFCRTKFQAEVVVRQCGLEHVIFRPSVIYGPGDHFTTSLVLLLRRLPVFPVLGIGGMRLQPVSIEDVTDVFAQAVERADVVGRTFELAGPERLKFTKIVRIVARQLDLRRPIVQLPAPLAGLALAVMDRLGLPAPLSPEQLDLLRESAVLSRRENPLRTVFRVEPLPFRIAVADYL